jgi:prepilin-type N-terminal cleavage/methylation domain-containing protein
MIMVRRGFTIVELIITITIMGILLTLAVVNVGTTQMKARDDQRITSIQTIGTYLDTFYANGPTGGSSIPIVTNVVVNPSFETGASGWTSYNSAPLTIITSGCPFGSQCLSVNTSAGAYTGAIYQTPSGGTQQTGVDYVYSAYVKGPAGQQLDISTRPTNTSYAYITEGGGMQIYTLTGNWQRLSTSPVSLDSTTPVVGLQIRARTANVSPFYVDGVMATQGDTLHSYHDGSSAGWSWSGAANASTSIGPSIFSSTPGLYPDVSITSSPLITAFLPDADVKSFTAPGQSDPYTTFIPATNNIQTAAGVLPQPTVNQYVYQPINTNGDLCTTSDCRKYNIYYRLEADNTVYRVTSKNQ